MSELEGKRGSGVGLLDVALIGAAIVGGIFVVLWIIRAVGGLILFAFKLAILVVVIAGIVRLWHLLSRRGD